MIEINGNLNSIYSIFGGPNSGRVRMLEFRIRTLDADLVGTIFRIYLDRTRTELKPNSVRVLSEFCWVRTVRNGPNLYRLWTFWNCGFLGYVGRLIFVYGLRKT
ncbi:uncharacterized protein M6B38_302215 [Iris pallida]|uniref:Uncharacterized protein n=1 Tax=Iris pallida TaxID=29817 RepID=A0AAX6HNE8_IRIPA|nr:uncharacterized protein M6B38_302215 [Iris pallida]